MLHETSSTPRSSQDHAGPVVVPSRWLGWAVVAASCAAFALVSWRLRGYVADDSWISVRYAENLARGDGAVWNPGGPSVEGFSNPLLVYLEALADAVGWSALSAARAIGVASGLACVVLVYRAGRAVAGETAAMTGALLTGVSAPFALWAVGGLETTVTAAVLTAAVLQVARPGGGRPVVAGALLALLPWLRPEGLVVALAVAVLGEGFAVLRRPTRRRALRRLTLVAGLPVLSQALLEVVRLTVYGHLLPNSALYKSGTGGVIEVAFKFVEHSGVVLVLAGTGLLVSRGRQLLLAVPALVYLVGSINTLDSANAYSRFFMPVWPQVALLAGLTVATVAAGAGRRQGAAAAACLAGLGALLSVSVMRGSLPEVDDWQDGYMACSAGAREDVASWLVQNTSRDTSFAISDAGLVPARAGGRPAIDNFLLNDPLIQETGPLGPQERADIVHDRRPDVLVLASRDAERFDAVYATGEAIYSDPRTRDFELAHVSSGGASCDYHLRVYRR